MVLSYLSSQEKSVAVLVSTEALSNQFSNMVQYVKPGQQIEVITYESFKVPNVRQYDYLIIDEVDYFIRFKPILRVNRRITTLSQLQRHIGDNCQIIGVTANDDLATRNFGSKYWGWRKSDLKDVFNAPSVRRLVDPTLEDMEMIVQLYSKGKLIEEAVKMIRGQLS